MSVSKFISQLFFWQTLDWSNEGLTSQQLEAKIAALSGKECEQVGRWVFCWFLTKEPFVLLFFFLLKTNKNSLYLGSNKLTSVSENISRFKSLRGCVRCFSVIFFTSFFLGFIWTAISWRVFQLASESWNNFDGERSIMLISLFNLKV